jgi:hypothetical protein
LPKVAVSCARESHDWVELFQIFIKKASFCGNRGTQQTPLITLKKPKQRLANPPELCIVRDSLTAKSLPKLTSLV